MHPRLKKLIVRVSDPAFRTGVAVLLGIAISACGSAGRMVTVYGKDAPSASGRLVAVHNGCAIVSTSTDLPIHLKASEQTNEAIQRRSQAWRNLRSSSRSVELSTIDSVRLEYDNQIGNGIFTGLAVGGAIMLVASLDLDEERGFGAAFKALAYIGLAGAAFLTSTIVGILTTRAERTVQPGDAGFEQALRDAAVFSNDLPPELDEIPCGKRGDHE